MRMWLILAAAAALMPVEAGANGKPADDEAAARAAPEEAVAPEEEKVVYEDDKVLYEKETRLEFNDGQVDGDLIRPEGDVVRSVRKSEFKSMIEKRRDFNEELRESLDE